MEAGGMGGGGAGWGRTGGGRRKGEVGEDHALCCYLAGSRAGVSDWLTVVRPVL